jgi:hypothetical protein
LSLLTPTVKTKLFTVASKVFHGPAFPCIFGSHLLSL